MNNQLFKMNSQLFKRVSSKLLSEGSEEPISNLLSLLAASDFKRNMDKLSDILSDKEFTAVKSLYDKLYAELKKHDV